MYAKCARAGKKMATKKRTKTKIILLLIVEHLLYILDLCKMLDCNTIYKRGHA